jgi:hypothetical protein
LAQAVLNFVTGISTMPALVSRYLALFTAAPTSDAGTGGTEVSGTGYARVQVAGAIAAAASFTTASTMITMGTSNPGWLVAGKNVYDATNGFNIGTVSSYSGTTLTLTATAAHASSGAADSLVFSAWPATSASSGADRQPRRQAPLTPTPRSRLRRRPQLGHRGCLGYLWRRVGRQPDVLGLSRELQMGAVHVHERDPWRDGDRQLNW